MLAKKQINETKKKYIYQKKYNKYTEMCIKTECRKCM